MARRDDPGASGVRIHGGMHDQRLEQCLELARRRAGGRPLQAELADLARLIAGAMGADVCSIYLREGEDVVMRANHGFDAHSVGHVRMRVGQGLTGLAVECLRPVTGSIGRDPRSKPFPGLGEEKYPAFLAVPLVHGEQATGALVLQRRETAGRAAFSPDDLRLSALAAGIVVRHLAGRVTTGAMLRLAGRGVGHGVAVGRIVETTFGSGEPRRRSPSLADVERALAEHAARCGRVQARILRHLRGSARAAEALVLATLDGHFPSALTELVEAGTPVPEAVAKLAADAARVRHDDPFLFARARDVEALGRIVLASAQGERSRIPPGCVVVAERLAAPEALLCVDHRVAAVALAAPPEQSSGLIVLEAVGIPAVAALEGLFQRAREGARAVVDADAGALVIDPARWDLTLARRRRNQAAATPPAEHAPRLRRVK